MSRFFLLILLFLTAGFYPPHSKADTNLQDAFFGKNAGALVVAGNMGSLLTRLIPNIIMVSGILFFLIIILGGFQLIIYGGQYNSPQRVAQSKNLITYGFIGFLIVASAYFILQIVTAVTGINFMDPSIANFT